MSSAIQSDDHSMLLPGSGGVLAATMNNEEVTSSRIASDNNNSTAGIPLMDSMDGVQVMGDALIGNLGFTGHPLNTDHQLMSDHHQSEYNQQPGNGMMVTDMTPTDNNMVNGTQSSSSLWIDPTMPTLSSSSPFIPDPTDPGNRKLDMSLDELIASSQHNQSHPKLQQQQQQELQYRNNYKQYYPNNYRQVEQPYHHQYKGRRGPSGNAAAAMSNGSNNNRINRNPNYQPHHRNSPFSPAAQSSSYQFPPPPPPFIPYSNNPTAQLLSTLQGSDLPLVNQSRLSSLQPDLANFVYGQQRHGNRALADLLRLPQRLQSGALRKSRLGYRAQPYDQNFIPDQQQPQMGIRDQIVAELVMQEQRTRHAALLAAAAANDNSPSMRGGVNERMYHEALGAANRQQQPMRKAFVDPVVMAEQSALSDSELLCPVMIEDETGRAIESPDDALIIRFKGTDVLKVRKARGDLILNSGGWKTLSTRLVLNKALKPLGIRIEEIPPDASSSSSSAPSGHVQAEAAIKRQQNLLSTTLNSTANEWRVVDSNAVFLASFSDGMVIGGIGASARRQLMARASVIAQHWKQVKSSLNMARKKG